MSWLFSPVAMLLFLYVIYSSSTYNSIGVLNVSKQLAQSLFVFQGTHISELGVERKKFTVTLSGPASSSNQPRNNGED